MGLQMPPCLGLWAVRGIPVLRGTGAGEKKTIITIAKSGRWHEEEQTLQPDPK
jgi:hypothetical protein